MSKTDAGLAWMLYDIDNPLYRGLVIRKNVEDTKDWVDRARRMYSGTKAEFTGHPPIINFSSGARIYVGHLKDENSYTKYQGHEYHRMLIEELTQIPSEELYLKLISSCRSTVDNLRPRVFATCNPGGVGHFWVKKRFVEPCKPMDTFIDKVSGRERIYIPATVDDNPTLLEKDPDYVMFLESLPPDLKAQWRYGSWENVQFKGQIYGECMKQAQLEERIYSYKSDPYRKMVVSFDIGLEDSMSTIFCQRIGQKNAIIDYQESNGKKWEFYGNMLSQKEKEYGVDIEKVILPHDGNKRGQDTLRSFKDVIEEFGYTVEILSRTPDVLSDIQIVKTIFPTLHFHSEKTAALLEALDQYRFDFDEGLQILRDKPKHDWTSHGCDCIRYLCMWINKQTNRVDSLSEQDDYLKRLIDKGKKSMMPSAY